MPLSNSVSPYREISTMYPRTSLFTAADATGPLHDCGLSRWLLMETVTYLSIFPSGRPFTFCIFRYRSNSTKRGRMSAVTPTGSSCTAREGGDRRARSRTCLQAEQFDRTKPTRSGLPTPCVVYGLIANTPSFNMPELLSQ